MWLITDSQIMPLVEEESSLEGDSFQWKREESENEQKK